MRVLAFAGSTRSASWNKKLLALAVAELKKQGAEVDHFDFTDLSVPVLLEERTVPGQQPPEVVALKDRVRAVDGIAISTPEYNYSIPGSLKNLLDWISRPPKDNPFRGKVVMQLGATPGPGGTIQAQNVLRHVMGVALGTWVMPGPAFTVSKIHEALDDQGAFKDPALGQQLEDHVRRFLAALA